MYCKSGCNNGKYSITLEVKDNNNVEILYKQYEYIQSEFSLKKWTSKKELFDFKGGPIKVDIIFYQPNFVKVFKVFPIQEDHLKFTKN